MRDTSWDILVGNSHKTVVILPLASLPQCRSSHLLCVVLNGACSHTCAVYLSFASPALFLSICICMVLSMLYFACFGTILRARFAFGTVSRVRSVFGTVSHAALLSVLFRVPLCFLAPFRVPLLFLAPFCVPILFSCTVLCATLVSRIVLRVLCRFLLHVACIAWFYHRFAFPSAFAYRAMMLIAWSSHEPGFAWFGTQTALLST